MCASGKNRTQVYILPLQLLGRFSYAMTADLSLSITDTEPAIHREAGQKPAEG